MDNNDPNQQQHQDGRLVLGLQAAVDLLRSAATANRASADTGDEKHKEMRQELQRAYSASSYLVEKSIGKLRQEHVNRDGRIADTLIGTLIGMRNGLAWGTSFASWPSDRVREDAAHLQAALTCFIESVEQHEGSESC